MDVRRRIFQGVSEAARDERGAEMVEWIVVVAVLATVAVLVFGPGGFLAGAMNNGINTIGNIITNAS
jgi:Flp pilus assembly pilin Flp